MPDVHKQNILYTESLIAFLYRSLLRWKHLADYSFLGVSKQLMM